MKKNELKKFVENNIGAVKRSYGLPWVFVLIRYVSKKDYYMAMAGNSPIPIIILSIDQSARKLGEEAIVGLLAHEFGHFFTSDEREADERALKAGFQKNLVAFHRAHNRKYKAFKSDEGMTLKEILAWKPE